MTFIITLVLFFVLGVAATGVILTSIYIGYRVRSVKFAALVVLVWTAMFIVNRVI